MSFFYGWDSSLIQFGLMGNRRTRMFKDRIDRLRHKASILASEAGQSIQSIDEYARDHQPKDDPGNKPLSTGGIYRGLITSSIILVSSVFLAFNIGFPVSFGTAALATMGSLAVGGIVGNNFPTAADKNQAIIESYSAYLDNIQNFSARKTGPSLTPEMDQSRASKLNPELFQSLTAHGIPHRRGPTHERGAALK